MSKEIPTPRWTAYDAKFNVVNRRACEVLGREVDEILGKRFESFVPDPDREATLEQVLTMRICPPPLA